MWKIPSIFSNDDEIKIAECVMLLKLDLLIAIKGGETELCIRRIHQDFREETPTANQT